MTNPLPPASSGQVFAIVRPLIGRRGGLLLAVSFLAVLVSTALGLVLPAALGALVDAAQSGYGVEAAVPAGAAVAGSVILGAAFAAIGFVGVARVMEPAFARLRERVVSAALTLPQRLVDRIGSGDLVARATDDIALAADTLPTTVPVVARSGFTIALTLIGLAVIDPWFAVIVVVVVPVHVYAVRRYLREAPEVFRAERAASARRGHLLLDGLRGGETVRAFGMEREQLDRLSVASWAAVRWQMRARALQNAFFSRLNAAEFAGMAAILVIGFLRMGNDAVTAGGVTTATLFFLALFGPMNELLFVIDDVQRAAAAMTRSVGVLVTEPVPDSRTTTEAAVVRLRDVRFGYGDTDVVHGIDLDIHPGETVALVGASGAGKSTVAGLVHGTHVQNAGTIAVSSGAEARTVMVSQEVHMFIGTLRDNLTLTAPEATDEELTAALTRIGAATAIAELPDALDTPVGPGSPPVPAAHAQLVALARVELADPVLVILDEPTAEAGSRSASALDDATARLLAGRSALVIAHRLEQARTADRIVVMDGGRIIEQGTHEELLAADGEYARLWNA